MNKKIVVTGGTKGIGRAIIEKFCSQGFDAISCSRNQEELDRLKKEVEGSYPGIKLHVFKADLSRKEEVAAFAEFVKSNDLAPDVLVNNTGVFIPGQVHTEEEGVLEQMIDTNLYSAYRLTRHLVGEMIDRKAGHIFNMCSIASITAYNNGGSYSISKFAMLGMSKALREELKDKGIRVTAIMPGATLTASWDGVDIPPERFMKSEDVAEACWAAWQMSGHSVVEELVIRPQLGDL
ncbi:SDR family oxidoreductase [Nafulsella turpanensis]|uniref:SDR family oxidoreductase n=1 Tax=Nafulsella turpanensis TaxID=1265690 RepID=UPI00034D4E5D|nr:SDR family oxidoreductase [Nafulsella turpanensis]